MLESFWIVPGVVVVALIATAVVNPPLTRGKMVGVVGVVGLVLLAGWVIFEFIETAEDPSRW